MTSFLCDQVIDFDATDAYEARDIESLIEQIKTSSDSALQIVVLLRNAHNLTTQAFAILYNYIRQPASSHAVFVLVSTDKSRIFPPLLDFVEHREVA